MIRWFIWNRQNKIRVNEAIASLEKIPELVQKHLADFQQFCAKLESKKLPRKVIWKPLDAALLKTNFDVAVFEDLGAAGIGAVGVILQVKSWLHYPKLFLCLHPLLLLKQLQQGGLSYLSVSLVLVAQSLKEILKRLFQLLRSRVSSTQWWAI